MTLKFCFHGTTFFLELPGCHSGPSIPLPYQSSTSSSIFSSFTHFPINKFIFASSNLQKITSGLGAVPAEPAGIFLCLFCSFPLSMGRNLCFRWVLIYFFYSLVTTRVREVTCSQRWEEIVWEKYFGKIPWIMGWNILFSHGNISQGKCVWEITGIHNSWHFHCCRNCSQLLYNSISFPKEIVPSWSWRLTPLY